MRRHVIRPFSIVFVVGSVFRNHFVEVTFEIRADTWVGVFVHGEACRGVLDKDVKLAGANLLYFRNSAFNTGGDQMKSALHRWQGDLVLKILHVLCETSAAKIKERPTAGPNNYLKL